MDINILNRINNTFEIGEQDIKSYSPLVLAYIGDCVYELVVRTVLIEKKGGTVQKLHKQATWYVKASTQSTIIDKLLPILSEEENDIYRRGKNAKSHTSPKNADIGDYHKATGFEALIGFLYMKKDFERILELLKIALSEEFDNN